MEDRHMISKIIAQLLRIRVQKIEHKIKKMHVKKQYNLCIGSEKKKQIIKIDMPKEKDKYLLSSIYPNEEVMRRVDEILLAAKEG